MSAYVNDNYPVQPVKVAPIFDILKPLSRCVRMLLVLFLMCYLLRTVNQGVIVQSSFHVPYRSHGGCREDEPVARVFAFSILSLGS